MGLRYLNNEEMYLISAYGLDLYGKFDKYDWTVFTDRGTEDVISYLRIMRGEEKIFEKEFGNNCIFPKAFNETIDNLLWWISKDKPDSFDIEKTIRKSMVENTSLFNHLIESRRRKEKEK